MPYHIYFQVFWFDNAIFTRIIENSFSNCTDLLDLNLFYRRFNSCLSNPTLSKWGVEHDENCYTSLKGLLAAGEISGGVHGKNRLMGNFLLEIKVFGRRASITAANEYKKKSIVRKLTLAHVHKSIKALDALKLKDKRYSPTILSEYRSDIVRDSLVQLYEQSL